MNASEPTAFHTAFARLTTEGIHCTIEDDGKTGETWASYIFDDHSELTWGTTSNTGAENSTTHPVTHHRQIEAFHATDQGDASYLFNTGDFDRDVTALLAKITELAAAAKASNTSDADPGDGHDECFGAHVTADGYADCDGAPF
ncbi:hypothetical protein ACFXJO_03530 [Streptomyces lavendulae]|uniref:hypothetical protein n=1 Tax=Streptomyces lavendulae TaxID=1914 RepID=UPI00369CCEE9